MDLQENYPENNGIIVKLDFFKISNLNFLTQVVFSFDMRAVARPVMSRNGIHVRNPQRNFIMKCVMNDLKLL